MDQDQHRPPTRGSMTQSQAYCTYQYRPNRMIIPTNSRTQATSPYSSSSYLRQQDVHQHIHQPQPQELQQQVNNFWTKQFKEIEETIDVRKHSFPLSRIRKIMKKDEDVRLISAEALFLFSMACEIFIKEVTLRSWINAEENTRKVLGKNDIATTIARNDMFSFLLNTIVRDDIMDPEALAQVRIKDCPRNDVFPYMPAQHVLGPPHGISRVAIERDAPDQTYNEDQTHPFVAQVRSQAQENLSSSSDDLANNN